ncbi:MAG: TSUP family transporter [Pseudomonadota bacterium]|nr:hypothetical protein [Gammaproteobacteria bacterium]MEC8010650.1 TSUP family transporter [Pseudomonadota bacterium]HBF08870.1 hypothetical protein [Gammaproteobacteria bacterium]
MDFISLSFEVLAMLFGVALFAGIIDTMAGGGGLITVPALLLSGLNPLAALATNKIQSVMGSATASVMMLRKKKVSWHAIKSFMLMSFIGSTLGTIAVQFIDTSILQIAIPIVLFFIGIYFLLSPYINKIERIKNAAPQTDKKYKYLTVPFIGLYDGVLGPGTGSFFSLAGFSLRKLPLVEAIAQAKTLNFASNLASLIVFIFSGQVAWVAGIVMMLGQLIGAWIGSHLLVKAKPELLRWVVIIVCFTVLGKYIADKL